jgi:dimethylhistidine N-methyltransferase
MTQRGLTPDITARFAVIEARAGTHLAAFAQDARAGLLGDPKSLPCRYFYDAEGSRLFEAICELPEYYLTRAEREILVERSAELSARFPTEVTLVELGSGSAAKTQILIEALLRRHESLRYVPVDLSKEMLEESAWALLAQYPDLEIVAVAGEYQDGLQHLHSHAGRPKLILWLGSSIGNLERREAAAFLHQVRDAMRPGDHLLVGIDLRKDRDILVPAYDDAAGVTARFNLNLLARINRELGGRFDLTRFRHRAVYNEIDGRVEMFLVSTNAQRVAIDGLGIEVSFAAGEAIHTENSYKYSRAEIESLAEQSGLGIEAQWFDTAAASA